MDPLNIGDEVNFNAEVDDYFGVTELKNVSDILVLSDNNEVIPFEISTGDLALECGEGEAYEGMFVEFNNAIIEGVDSEYNSYYINDGSGTAKFDDYFFNFDDGDWPDLNIGDTIDSVKGTVHYYFGEYVIYPRSLNDVTCQDCSGGGSDPTPSTIYDIQYTSDVGSGDDCYPSPLTGDNVNVTARLSSESKTGEIFISDSSYNSPSCKTDSSQHLLKKLEIKESTVELKGQSEAKKVYIGSMSG